VRQTNGERDDSAVNVWCHFAVRGNFGVSNIGTHISAGKHLFNSHPSSRPPSLQIVSERFQPSCSLTFPLIQLSRVYSMFRANVPLKARRRNAIRLKAVHRAHTDVIVPINGLEAILFLTCTCTKPFQSWPVTTKMKVTMYAITLHTMLYAARKIDWF